MTKNNKINVVYILSLGHSGSTLMSSILGSHNGIDSIGEMHLFSNQLNLLCSCGYFLTECSFWKNILPSYLDQCSAYANKTLMYNTNLTMFQKFKYYITKKQLKNENELIENYHLLFSLIKQQTGNNTIILNCKNALLGYLLYKSNLFNFKFIHLHRNPMANLASYKSKKQRISEPFFLFSYIKQYIIQNLHNLFMLSYVSKNDKYNISYEDMCKNPQQQIKSLFKKLNYENISYNPDRLDEKSPIYFGKCIKHDLGGNRIRFKPIKKIINKEKWRTFLTVKEKVFCFIFCYPLAFILNLHSKKH